MAYRLTPFDILTEQFRKLPGIGGKSAQRLAFHILNMTDEQVKQFVDSVVNAKRQVHNCPVCQNLTDAEICSICSNPKRDKSIICVVSTPSDVLAIEKTNEYSGLYHVLHGLLSPADNIGPQDIRIKELIARLQNDEVKELILATNPTVEGDATAMYISKLLKPIGIHITRLAFGIPVGGDLEYADELTLTRAMENRREI